MSEKRKDKKVNFQPHQARGTVAVDDAISRQLRDFYDSVAEEPIPDRFIDLLEKLDQAEEQTSQKAGGGADDA